MLFSRVIVSGPLGAGIIRNGCGIIRRSFFQVPYDLGEGERVIGGIVSASAFMRYYGMGLITPA